MDISKLNYSFHDLPGPTLGSYSPMVAGVLGVCHVMPGSGAVYADALTALLLPKNGKATDRFGTKTLVVCAITPRATGLKTLGNFFSCFLCLCSTSRRIHENTTSTAGDGKSWLSHVAVDRTLIDCSTLVPRYANKLDGGRPGMMWLVELA